MQQLSHTASNTIILLREKLLFPSNKKEFLECTKKLDNDPINIEKVVSINHGNIYFTITKYYEDNPNEIDAVLKYISNKK